ncbi:glycosyltransferase family 4 protein [uncultured Pseudacidovorax sp.]|uniref:glycosyltransferase family 4 protein n=1 Tax=uncultured Pseudacidovorax sp. TaxID=679313 RepID=UPI0025CC238F|nr:glycosyltransferase family 4 protein [uncultured Pseudacidovorax sp.]
MNVLFPMRADAETKMGGDTLQVKRYIAELAKLGIRGTLSTAPKLSLHDVDLVHFTNIDRPLDLAVHWRQVTGKKIPYVISPIHHSYAEIEAYEKAGRRSTLSRLTKHLNFLQIEKLRSLVRCAINHRNWLPYQLPLITEDLSQVQREILAQASAVLYLNEREFLLARTEIGASEKNKNILPNGIEKIGLCNDYKTARDIDFLCVGRIEARKNQRSILLAAQKKGYKINLVGAVNQYHKEYAKEVLELVEKSGGKYHGVVDKAAVALLMSRAKCHISASWFEVASLVDIEAFMYGCSVICSVNGGTQEVLGDKAVYCVPNDIESIARALEMALQKPQAVGSEREMIFPTWEAVAAQLSTVYQRAITDV